MEIELAFAGFWKDPYVNKYIFCIYFYIFIFFATILFSIIKNT